MRSLPVAALVVLFTALLGAPAALAHTSLQKSTPAAGASLAAPPAEVSLTFGEAVRLPASPIRVAGPGGAVWTVGKATVTGATVTAPVAATGPAGAYTLTWQVISDDGDTIRGTVRFTLTAPAAPVVAPASPPGTVAASSPARHRRRYARRGAVGPGRARRGRRRRAGLAVGAGRRGRAGRRRGRRGGPPRPPALTRAHPTPP